MAYHKGATRGINRAYGTAYTRPLKVWGTERLQEYAREIDFTLYGGIVIKKIHILLVL